MAAPMATSSTLIADDIHTATCAYLEHLGKEGEDNWETVDVADGAVTVHPSQAATINQQWLDLFNQLFILGSVRNIHLQQADDLLFFVRKAALATSRRNRLIVRRKGRHLPSDCAPGGTLCDAIDWPRSALLNMVLQTPYFLSVSACSRSELPHVLRYNAPSLPSMTQVTKHVFASPTRVDVNLDSSRTGSAEPDVTYPHICFAVDNFDCTFESLVLRDQDHCYSVCLWGQAPCTKTKKDKRGGKESIAAGVDAAGVDAAGVDAAGLSTAQHDTRKGGKQQMNTVSPVDASSNRGGDPLGVGDLADQLERTQLDGHTEPHPVAVEDDGVAQCKATTQLDSTVQQDSTSIPSERAHAATEENQPSTSATPAAGAMVLLFAGYVSFGQLQAVVDTSGLHPMRLWMKAGDAQHHVLMKGPGGVGHADVAVTVCSPRDGTHSTTETTAVYRADQGSPPPAVQLKRALFSSAAKLARAAVGARDEGDSAVRCALMTLTLPVDQVARQLFGVGREGDAPTESS